MGSLAGPDYMAKRAVRRLTSTPSDASDVMFQMLAARASSTQDAKFFEEESLHSAWQDALDGSADIENCTEDTRSGSPTSSAPDLLEQEVHVEDECGGESFRFYGRQVGGHFCLVKPLSSPSGCIVVRRGGGVGNGDEEDVDVPLQQIVLKPVDDHEHSFYRLLQESASVLAPHVPTLYGVKKLSQQQLAAMVEQAHRKAEGDMQDWKGGRERSFDCDTFIALEDLANGMALPCILDLKMGFKQRSRRYTEEKRLRCERKASGSTSGSIGFRLCGLRAQGHFYDKYFGREIGKADLLSALEEFFEPLHIEACRQHIIVGLLARLRELRAAVASCEGWRFWNTSLLLLYDCEGAERPPELRLIDFAHCTAVKDPSPDKEFLTALHNVEVFLEALLSGHSVDWVLENLLEPPKSPDQDQEELEEGEVEQLPFCPALPSCTPTPEDDFLGEADVACGTPPFGAKRERSPSCQSALNSVLLSGVLPTPTTDGLQQDARIALEAKRLKHMPHCKHEANIALLSQAGDEVCLQWAHIDSAADVGCGDQPFLLSILQPTAFIKEAFL